jgi:lambda family phage tail tape measure protein
MADLRYTVDVDTKGAQSALTGLQRSLGGLAAAFGSAFALSEIATVSARFEDLRTTLGILYKDVEAGAQAFEQIKVFATQSVFSVEDLTASVVKLKAAGLEPSIQQLSLFADVASVSADSVGALQAITDLFARTTAGGLGLEDLNRLADRGIPVFTILSERLGINRLEISKLGQTAEGASAILAALTEGLDEAFGGASTARADNLSQAFSNLQDAIQNAADAIGEGGFNDALTDSITGITNFIEKNDELIKGVGEALGIAIRFAAENLKYLAALMAGVFSAAAAGRIIAIVGAVVQLAKGFRDAAIAGTLLQGVTGVGLAKVAAGVAAALGTVAIIEEATGDASDNINQLKEDLAGLTDGVPTGPLTAPTMEDVPDATTQIEAVIEKQNEATRAAINYFDTYKENVDNIVNTVDQQGKLLQMTEAQANVQRELFRFQQRYFDTINPLQRKVTELRAKDTDESRVQADEIERQIGLITELYNTSVAGLKETLELREANRREEEKMQLFVDTRRQLQQDLNGLIRESNRELQDLSLTPFERELAEINRTVDDNLIRSINNIKTAWEDGLISSDEYILEMKRLEDMAQTAEDSLRANAETIRDTQRSFAYGWKEAFESYEDEATNAAKAAERIFEKTTKGMEDMIVDFAKTGKFEFKSLINTILEELLRSQIQQIIAQTFGAFGSTGSRGSGGSNFFSDLFAGFFANGGMIPAGTFGVVGERGPELVTGPAQVTPLTGSNVTYNISAVDAMSFKQMVARDPGFIHAVAQQGGRAVPTRR